MRRAAVDQFTHGSQPKELSVIVDSLRQDWLRQLREDEARLEMQLRHYIPAKLGYTDHEPVEKRVDGIAEMRAFLGGSKPALLLLGDSGAGKSLFCQSLVDELWRNPTEWVPLFIHLPLISLRPGIVFESYLKDQCRLSFEQIDVLKENIKILLILDAYDEMPEECRGKNFYQELELYKFNIKVIISCRTEGLVNFNSVKQHAMFTPTKIGAPAISIDRRYVQFFDEKQIPLYIERWKKLQKELNSELVIQEMDYFAEINRLPGVAEMITNPFILWAVMEVLPNLLKNYADQAKLERYDKTRKALFDRFTQGWFERQRDKLLKNRKINADWGATIVADFYNYCKKLADYMWQMKVTRLTYEPHQAAAPSILSLASHREAIAENRLDQFFAQDGHFNNERHKPLAIIRQGALLRVFGGNTYTFIHQSLMEYFSARRLFESATNKATIALGLEINTQLMTQDLPRIRFGVDCIAQDPDFEKALWDIIEESKHEERVATAAANAVTIMVAANISFVGENLRGIRIRYANIAGGNFEGADLREADLRDVNISQARLTKANLSGSCVDRLQTGELWGEALDSGVKACAFSRDGKQYVVMTEKSVVVYETVSHKKMKTHFPGLVKKDELTALALSPRLDSVLLGTYKGNILLLSLAEGMVLRQWRGHKATISAVVISPEGEWALSGSLSFDGTIKRWDCVTGECVATWQGHSSWVSALALSSEGDWALSGSADGDIKHWNCVTGECVATWQEHTGKVNALALSLEGGWALSGSSDYTIKRWDCETGACVATWHGHMEPVSALVLSPEGGWALSAGSWDKTIKRWDCETGKCVATWQGHTGVVNALALSSESGWALSGSWDKTIKRWDCVTSVCVATWQGHTEKVTGLALSPEGSWALSGSYDKTIKRWDCVTGACVATWQAHTYRVTTLVLSPEGGWALSGANDGTIQRWDCLTGACVATWHGHENLITALVLSPEGGWALSGSYDKTIKRWDCATGKCVATWEGHTAMVTALALSPEGRWAISGSGYWEHTIKRWDCLTGVCVATWQGHTEKVTALALSPKADWVLSGSDDNTIKHWDCVKGKCVATWEGHTYGVYLLALSPEGSWVVSSGKDRNVIIWQVSKGKERARYSFTYHVMALSWSLKDPTLIVMGMEDGSISAWTFQEDTVSLHLRWRSKAWGLQLDDCQLLNVHSEDGKVFPQQRLLEQKGAKVQLSTKSSEAIIKQRTLWSPYVIGSPNRSLFDNSFIVRPSAWVITVARRKLGEGRQHAFLILESVEEGYCRIRRIDFVLELRHAVLPEGASQPQKTDTFGQGLIEIADKSFDDATRLAEDCYHRSVAISFNQAVKLLKAIYEDKSRRLAYCKLGGSSLYGFFRMREAVEHHNCLSWIRKHLEAIDVDILNGSLMEFFVEVPSSTLPDDRSVDLM